MCEKQEKIKQIFIDKKISLPYTWSWKKDIKGLYYNEPNGKKRYGIIKECLHCEREFLVRNDWKEKVTMCSKFCNYEMQDKKIKLNCDWCKKSFSKQSSKLTNSKSGFYFCTKECKDNAQKIDGLKEIHPNHYKDGYSNYSERAFKKYGCKCVDCNITIKALLQVHHKDGNRENGDIKNLEIVCSNHHALRHMVFRNGNWISDYKVLTSLEDLEILKKELNKQLQFYTF